MYSCSRFAQCYEIRTDFMQIEIFRIVKMYFKHFFRHVAASRDACIPVEIVMKHIFE